MAATIDVSKIAQPETMADVLPAFFFMIGFTILHGRPPFTEHEEPPKDGPLAEFLLGAVFGALFASR